MEKNLKDYKISRVSDSGIDFIELELNYNDYTTTRLFTYVIASDNEFYINSAPSYLTDKENYNQEVQFIYGKIGYNIENIERKGK